MRYRLPFFAFGFPLFLPACFLLLFSHASGAGGERAPSGERDADLLETGSASRLVRPPVSPGEIKIISYNIRWRGGDELRRLIDLLKTDAQLAHASIIGLQEVDRHRKRTGNVNTARQLAEALGMYYAWAAPPAPKDEQEEEEETGVEILSPYPLSDVRRIVLPVEGPKGRRRVALGATIKIGLASVRVYSVHAETRISVEQKTQQLQAVLDDLDQSAKTERALVLGDFNTWHPASVRETDRLFTRAGFSTPFPDDEPTFFRKIILGTFELKLDWVWLRGFARPAGYGIERRIELSDHWPLRLSVKL